MGVRCYTSNEGDSTKDKMNKLKNSFEKKNLIGIGSSSKVKCNILIINNIYTYYRFGK